MSETGNYSASDFARQARMASVRDRLMALEEELKELGFTMASMRVGSTARSLFFAEHTRRKMVVAIEDEDEWD